MNKLIIKSYNRSDLIKGSGGSLCYHVPIEWSGSPDNWINRAMIRKVLLSLGYTMNDYYDRWFLNITVKSDRPKCPYCNSVKNFRSIYRGYDRTCSSKSCINKLKSSYFNDSEWRSMHSKNTSLGTLRAFELDPECNLRRSESLKAAWAAPNSVFNTESYRKSLSDGLKRSHADPNSGFNKKDYGAYGRKISEAWKDSNSGYNTKDHKST